MEKLTVSEFLKNGLNSGRMNEKTLLTVSYKRKKYLSPIKDCDRLFGSLTVKKCVKRKDFDGTDMKNSFNLNVM